MASLVGGGAAVKAARAITLAKRAGDVAEVAADVAAVTRRAASIADDVVDDGAGIACSKSPKYLFIEGADAMGGQRIRPRNLYRELRKSEIGRETLEAIDSNGIEVILGYQTKGPDLDGMVTYGYAVGDHLSVVNVLNTQSVKQTAETVIHEVTHNLGIRGTQRAEVIAEIRAAKHHGKVTSSQIRDIIKRIKRDYHQLSWE